MAQYYSLLTAIGAAQIANAISLGGTVTVTQFAAGTGDGAEYDPTEDQTALKSEVYRGNVNSIDIVTGTPNVIEFHCVIPVTEGGWTLREVGLFDGDGNLLIIAKYPSSYKPVQSEGTAGDFSLKIQVGVVNTDVVELKIDPAVVLASRQFVKDEISKSTKGLSDIEGLQEALDDKSDSDHGHTAAEISGLGLSLSHVQYFSASGTYTPTSKTKKIIAKVAGAGGSGGVLSVYGNSGGDSSFSINADTLTATGGDGGTFLGGGIAVNGKSHGVGSGGDLNLIGSGGAGSVGLYYDAGNASETGGTGGTGGYSEKLISISDTDTGTVVVGAGGAGVSNGGTTENGSNGYVVIEEYK
ncbi:phage tail protein [Terasakiella pusilla]|uniref:phage tail-collar fiber domain-containing protein n=1 Tax=Terasakiella pusilla TaxID=64973 RepID=UPI003AA8794F